MAVTSSAKASDPRPVPTMLDLVRLSRRTLFPPGGRELCHQIALLTELREDQEVLVAACGPGTTVEYYVREFGVVGTGVDPDPVLVGSATGRARELGLQQRMHFQSASLEDLPYRDEVFDVTIGEIGLTAQADPARAISELCRVTKPGGRVVLVQLVWKAPVDPRRQAVLSRHLGARPLMLVELKRILRASGVERMHTEEWSDRETAFRPAIKKPFPDFAELFTIPEKVAILRRAWRRWGWRGVMAALAREREVHRLLTKERILGLDLLTGWRLAGSSTPGEGAAEWSRSDRAEPARDTEVAAVRGPARTDAAGTRDTKGLPLFVQGEGG